MLTQRPEKRARGLLKLAISAILLITLVSVTGWDVLAGSLLGAQPGWLALALGFYVLGVGLRALRWRVLLRGQPIGLGRLAALYFVSFFFNSFLPTGIGGDVVRAGALARTTGLPAAVSSVLADRVVGLVAVSWLAVLVVPLAGASLAAPIASAAVALAVGIPVVWWLLARHQAAGLAALERAVPALRPLAVWRKLGQTAEALAGYTRAELARALAVSLVFGLTNALTYACIGAAVRVELPLAYYLVVSPLITLVLLVPFSFNGLGTRDWAYQLLFVPAGVSPAAALSMSLLYHALNLLTALAGGLLYALPGRDEERPSGVPLRRLW